MLAIMSENVRKMAKTMHNTVKKFDWVAVLILVTVHFSVIFSSVKDDVIIYSNSRLIILL